jgi:hypothetical protein
VRAGCQQAYTNGIVIAFIAGSVLYVFCLSTMAELGENYRYKFLVEPLVLVLTAAALGDLVRRLSVMRRPGLLDGQGRSAYASRNDEGILSE